MLYHAIAVVSYFIVHKNEKKISLNGGNQGSVLLSVIVTFFAIRGAFEKYIAWHHNSTKYIFFGNKSTSATGWFVHRLNSTWHARAAHARNR